ncbi:hypothetical protein A374_14610 [Fictibacillus macauensis ZFHKF-1]|uniref:DUF3813 domain-containing protein n=1 Tax=Fictibacillus macauensis ZFHKF-1 TaxID=1196324 RepID=I8UCQ8_9BACL|nr:DUF3813 family protein [Fictibacillus macauensis]EIT84568.1 hypothetical protein A374_14610 [Fictibacillus macauensis ZFHKF-1]
MGNSLFQRAKEAVSHLLGQDHHEHQSTSTHQEQHITSQTQQTHAPQQHSDIDASVAQNLFSSAMANSSGAERQQFADLQEELTAHHSSSAINNNMNNESHELQPSSQYGATFSSQAPISNDAQTLLSSAMENASDEDRQQLADLQKELKDSDLK